MRNEFMFRLQEQTMTFISKKFRSEEPRLSLHLSAPPPPYGAQVGAFSYDDNLILENETLGRMYSTHLNPDAPRALQCKWSDE